VGAEGGSALFAAGAEDEAGSVTANAEAFVLPQVSAFCVRPAFIALPSPHRDLLAGLFLQPFADSGSAVTSAACTVSTPATGDATTSGVKSASSSSSCIVSILLAGAKQGLYLLWLCSSSNRLATTLAAAPKT